MDSIPRRNCSCLEQRVFEYPAAQSTNQQIQCHPPYAKKRSIKRLGRTEYYIIRGYLTICCVSALIALLSILLMHALSSIWLDPVKSRELNEDFVYVTIALATASASLNFYAIATFGIQIYLVYTDYRQDEQRMILYLQKVATVRFIAAFSVFFSIPLFMTSFGCYLYMEFRRIAALIAISILSVSVLCMIVSTGFSYYKWNQTLDEIIQLDGVVSSQRFTDCPMHENSNGILNPSFDVGENTNKTKKQHNNENKHKRKVEIESNDCCNQIKLPLPRKVSSVNSSRFGLGLEIKDKLKQAVTRKHNLSSSDGSKSQDSLNASTLV